jgi:hypothetical protein
MFCNYEFFLFMGRTMEASCFLESFNLFNMATSQSSFGFLSKIVQTTPKGHFPEATQG